MYKKNFYRKKKGYNKKRSVMPYGLGKYAKYAGYALSAYKMAKYLKSVINVEYKYHDVELGATNIGITPNITCLNIINQGDTSGSRDGDSIKLTKLNFSGWVEMDPAATEVTRCRVTLVQLMQSNGQAVTEGGIWDSGDLFNRKRKLDYTDNIKILKDFKITLQPGANQSKYFSCNLKLNDHVKYKGTAGTIADVMTNSYWVYVRSASDTHKPAVTWNNRIRFIDN